MTLPEPLKLRETTEGVELEVCAIAGSSVNALTGFRQGALVIKVTTAPEKGRANNTLLRVLSGTLGLSKGKVRLIRGEHHRNKTFLISGMNLNQVTEVLGRIKNQTS